MDKRDLIKMATDFVEDSDYNRIPKEIALSETIIGMKIFEAPLLAFGAAERHKPRYGYGKCQVGVPRRQKGVVKCNWCTRQKNWKGNF